jgi:hypothetical protein
MESRDLIRDDNPQILIDTKSVDNTQFRSNDNINKLLNYQQHEHFEFLRTPDNTSHDPLDNIEQYRIEKNPDKKGDSLLWGSSWSAFQYTDTKLTAIQDRLSERDVHLSTDDLQITAVRCTLNSRAFEEDNGILLTENEQILSNRRTLEHEFGGINDVKLNIMTTDEAAEFLGLFLRYRNDFTYYPDYSKSISISLDRSGWNWALTDLSIAHSGGIDGLNTRIENLVTGLDELGFQYYMGTGNHTNNYTIYHFNYCISLITGVFDSLALHTRDKFEFELEDKKTTIRTGEPLFKKVRGVDDDLWSFIESNHPFVEMIYAIRPHVIHKDDIMMRGPGFKCRNMEGQRYWNSHILKLNDMEEKYLTDFYKYYRQMNDKLLGFDPMTKWGFICVENTMEHLPENDQFIEPYQFIKTASQELFDYVDMYLSTLGTDDRLQMLSKEHPDRYDDLIRFQNHMMSPIL